MPRAAKPAARVRSACRACRTTPPTGRTIASRPADHGLSLQRCAAVRHSADLSQSSGLIIASAPRRTASMKVLVLDPTRTKSCRIGFSTVKEAVFHNPGRRFPQADGVRARVEASSLLGRSGVTLPLPASSQGRIRSRFRQRGRGERAADAEASTLRRDGARPAG